MRSLNTVLADNSPLRNPLDWWLDVFGVVFAIVIGAGVLLVLVSFWGLTLATCLVWAVVLSALAAVVTTVLILAGWFAASLFEWMTGAERRG